TATFISCFFSDEQNQQMSNVGDPGQATPTQKPLLRLKAIEKSFGDLKVLAGVSADIYRGEVVSIIGGSGSGKSTLLRCVNLMERPSGGTIEFENFVADFTAKPNLTIGEEQLRNLRAQVGMVFQSYNLWPHMTVVENVMCAPMLVNKK